MNNKIKTLIIGALLAGLAALFQSIPVIYSEIFVLLTVFSALPIYLIARINPKTGCEAYIVAAVIVMLFSVHESLFFIFTNGIIGLSLGILNYYTHKKTTIYVVASLALAISLSIMTFVIGIPVFGVGLSFSPLFQLFLFFVFSTIYVIIYNQFANLVFKIVRKHYNIE